MKKDKIFKPTGDQDQHLPIDDEGNRKYGMDEISDITSDKLMMIRQYIKSKIGKMDKKRLIATIVKQTGLAPEQVEAYYDKYAVKEYVKKIVQEWMGGIIGIPNINSMCEKCHMPMNACECQLDDEKEKNSKAELPKGLKFMKEEKNHTLTFQQRKKAEDAQKHGYHFVMFDKNGDLIFSKPGSMPTAKTVNIRINKDGRVQIEEAFERRYDKPWDYGVWKGIGNIKNSEHKNSILKDLADLGIRAKYDPKITPGLIYVHEDDWDKVLQWDPAISLRLRSYTLKESQYKQKKGKLDSKMKLTKEQLEKIIREEVQSALEGCGAIKPVLKKKYRGKQEEEVIEPHQMKGAKALKKAITSKPSAAPLKKALAKSGVEEVSKKPKCTCGATDPKSAHMDYCPCSKSKNEVSPPGWSGTTKAMEKHKDIKNPYALAYSMKKKGYKSHYKPVKEEQKAED